MKVCYYYWQRDIKDFHTFKHPEAQTEFAKNEEFAVDVMDKNGIVFVTILAYAHRTEKDVKHIVRELCKAKNVLGRISRKFGRGWNVRELTEAEDIAIEHNRF